MELDNAFRATNNPESAEVNLSFPDIMEESGRLGRRPDPPLPWKIDKFQASHMAEDLNEHQALKDVDDYFKAIPEARQEHFIDMVNHKLTEAKSDLSLSMKCTAEGNLLVLNQNGKEIQSDKIDKAKK